MHRGIAMLSLLSAGDRGHEIPVGRSAPWRTVKHIRASRPLSDGISRVDDCSKSAMRSSLISAFTREWLCSIRCR
jgi:hypothetical protein